MGKYMRKCKLISEVAVMATAPPELTHVGVKTRARTLAMATEARAENNNKRSKVGRAVELGFYSSFNDQQQLQNNQQRRIMMITPDLTKSPATSDNNSASCSGSSSSGIGLSDSRCSGNNGSCDELVSGRSLMRSFLDLESSEGFKFEKSTNFSHQRDSDLSSGSNNLESTARPNEANSGRRSSTAEEMPTETEIEEFFSEFEKEEEKRFSEKYNYDIAKDAPQEGRYDWIPMKQ